MVYDLDIQYTLPGSETDLTQSLYKNLISIIYIALLLVNCGQRGLRPKSRVTSCLLSSHVIYSMLFVLSRMKLGGFCHVR